jgi:hypothetical protein
MILCLRLIADEHPDPPFHRCDRRESTLLLDHLLAVPVLTLDLAVLPPMAPDGPTLTS